MLLRRTNDAEILDDFSIIDKRIDKVLLELKKINKFLGGKNVSVSGIKKLLSKPRILQTKILDVGCGGSDVLENLSYQIQNLHIFTTDLNLRVCNYLKDSTSFKYSVCSNARFLPFKSKSFDVIHLSLFLHHFSKDEIVNLLKTLYEEAKFGIVINDLRRNIIAYLGIKLLAIIFIKSSIVKNDAPLSVRRGFTKKEIEEFLKEINVPDYSIKRKWAFRWLIIIRKPVPIFVSADER